MLDPRYSETFLKFRKGELAVWFRGCLNFPDGHQIRQQGRRFLVSDYKDFFNYCNTIEEWADTIIKSYNCTTDGPKDLQFWINFENKVSFLVCGLTANKFTGTETKYLIADGGGTELKYLEKNTIYNMFCNTDYCKLENMGSDSTKIFLSYDL